MNFKLSDAEQENREAVKEKTKKIKRLRSVYDQKSFKRILSQLWKETCVLRSELRDHNDQKIAWLREKYQDQRVEFGLPEDLAEYRDVNIFSSKFEATESSGLLDVTAIGNIDPPLDDDEISALQLPPKMAIEEGLTVSNFKHEMSMMSNKLVNKVLLLYHLPVFIITIILKC